MFPPLSSPPKIKIFLKSTMVVARILGEERRRSYYLTGIEFQIYKLKKLTRVRDDCATM